MLGEVRVAAGYSKVTSAVADLGAHRERGVEVARGSPRLLADEHALRPPALQPDEGAAVGIPRHIAEARGAGQLVGREGLGHRPKGRISTQLCSISSILTLSGPLIKTMRLPSASVTGPIQISTPCSAMSARV